MLHPIFSLLIRQPHLVIDHVAGYAGLIREEATSVGTEVAKRAIAWGAALLCALVFLLLAGVAIMLGALHGQFHWSLVVVPAVPLVIAVLAFMQARKPLPHQAFVELRSQLDADARTLHELGAQS